MQCDELFEVGGQHLFVAADHGQSLPQGAAYNFVGSLGIVDEFDNEIDFRVVEDIVGLVCEADVGLGVAFQMAHTNAADHRFLGWLQTGEHVVEPTAYTAETEESYMEAFVVHSLLFRVHEIQDKFVELIGFHQESVVAEVGVNHKESALPYAVGQAFNLVGREEHIGVDGHHERVG